MRRSTPGPAASSAASRASCSRSSVAGQDDVVNVGCPRRRRARAASRRSRSRCRRGGRRAHEDSSGRSAVRVSTGQRRRSAGAGAASATTRSGQCSPVRGPPQRPRAVPRRYMLLQLGPVLEGVHRRPEAVVRDCASSCRRWAALTQPSVTRSSPSRGSRRSPGAARSSRRYAHRQVARPAPGRSPCPSSSISTTWKESWRLTAMTAPRRRSGELVDEVVHRRVGERVAVVGQEHLVASRWAAPGAAARRSRCPARCR